MEIKKHRCFLLRRCFNLILSVFSRSLQAPCALYTLLVFVLEHSCQAPKAIKRIPAAQSINDRVRTLAVISIFIVFITLKF